MTRTICASALALLGWVATCSVVAGPPMGWRNDGTGQFPAATPPSEWSTDKNVLWKVALPGSSYAAPIVVGERLFVVSDPGELLCINRADGKILWRKSNTEGKAPMRGAGGRGKGGRGGRGKGGFGGGDRTAGQTAATPVSDGKLVAAVYGNGVAAVYTVEGKLAWGRFIESSSVGKGHAASPLLLDGKLIVHFADLVALDLATGKEVWRTELSPSHASPVATKLGKENLIIVPSGAVVRARDGKVLAKGKFRTSDNSPVLHGDTLCIGGQGALKLAQTDGGDVTLTALWGNPVSGGGGGGGGRGRGGEKRYPSPLVHGGLLYSVTTSGMLDVLDAKTGERAYRQRLDMNQVYSSVALAGDLLYVLDMQGKAVVFKPGKRFDRVAVNQLEGTGSCPVFAGDHLYVRGRRNLYCHSAKAAKPKAKSAE